MSEDTRNKSKGWLKNVLSNRNEVSIEEIDSEIVDAQFSSAEGSEHSTPSLNSNPLLSKDNQDKVSLDMILALENMLNDRQLSLYQNKSLENQLSAANDTINRFKHDLGKKELLLQEKNVEINALENNLTTKQMNYDQLLEDYKDYQFNTKNDLEKISTKLETEIAKYKKLDEEFTNTEYQHVLKVRELEERIRSFEIDNHRFVEQYERVLREKNDLMNTINDFTERMSFSFSSKSSTSGQNEE